MPSPHPADSSGRDHGNRAVEIVDGGEHLHEQGGLRAPLYLFLLLLGPPAIVDEIGLSAGRYALELLALTLSLFETRLKVVGLVTGKDIVLSALGRDLLGVVLMFAHYHILCTLSSARARYRFRSE